MSQPQPPFPPPPPPPPLGYQSPYPNQDAQHLRTLSICWYILAAFQCLGICAGAAYFVAAIIFAAVGINRHHANEPPPALFAAIFGCAGIAIIIITAVIAFLYFHTARSLANRRSYTFCFVLAIIACLNIPLGTILGIFTLVVLSRPSVKASFS